MSVLRGAITAGVLKESTAGENRVAMTPEGLRRLTSRGIEVLVESGAGERAWYPDAAYKEAGARVSSRDEVVRGSDALLAVGPPPDDLVGRLREGQFVLALLQARTSPRLVGRLREAGAVAIGLDLLPRTLSSAQSMDALTSQANVAGYKSVLVAADVFSGYLPMLMTAAGTVPPAKVLVLGTGVAGLQAIGTAHRLGARVSAYDVRPAARPEAESLGAVFLDLGTPSGEGEGGYARELSAEEQQAQRASLRDHIGEHDIVITTAQVPGHRPPLLVSADSVAAMRPGSVVVDLGASALGGNVEGSEPGRSVVTDNGVTVIGAPDLPSRVPRAASAAYARNVSDLLLHFVRDGRLRVDPDDAIDAAVVVTGLPPVAPPAPAGGTRDAAPTTGGPAANRETRP
ncbi:NAD(P) transhydrogenase subunit alpha [Streptomyces hygroscopicus subsp. hygroscopicus]|uniref:NAD(P) transhydrogenase subunit alpha n=1 Tax=Streptomyces sp. KHY 26 TaxID=3097359 RepID=UPI0024A30B74|nr:NAD(P) transhydrogenase subunit alpha [Streptomyces hygroscopicus]GLX50408.1 NAD(P) transhydrogenase subunit alpha [Streptomyces hygroscopicus subsp. hygroscopicus]